MEQLRNPKNYDLIYKALIKAGRKDLIGFGEKCLIKPPRNEHGGRRADKQSSNNESKSRIKKRK